MELMGLFGIFGFIVYFGLLVSVFLILKNNYNLMVVSFLVISFILLANVPSSILAHSGYFALVTCILFGIPKTQGRIQI